MDRSLLIVDDDARLDDVLCAALHYQGYRIYQATSGSEAVALTQGVDPDLVLLDPDRLEMPGLAVLQSIRSRSTVPIIVLTGRNAEQDKVAALNAGADDYVTKPFGMNELIARVHTALRHRPPGSEKPVLSVGPLMIDYERRQVKREGALLRLTPTEYALLRILALNVGRVVTHRELLRAGWGDARYETKGHYLRIYIWHLRNKIEPNPTRPQYIVTAPGIGYRFVAPETE